MICQKGLPASLAPASVALCALIASALLPAGAAERAEPQPAPRHVTLDDMNRIKWPGDPQLSPDGRQIAYEVDGQLYVVATNGGEPRAVTSAGSTASQPFWSHDGAWLYFLSDRSQSKNQLFKLPLTSFGEAMQVIDFDRGVDD